MTPQMPIFEEDWLPLRAAEKFGFDLPYIVGNDTRIYFRLRSWVAGCLGEDSAVDAIRNMRRKGVFSKHAPSSIVTISEDIGGQSVDFEYVTDEVLYRLTEDFRSIKSRPIIAAIKDYLAKSGAFVDKVRREATPAIEPPKNREEEKYLAKQIVYGKLDKPAALTMLQTRRDTKTTYKELMAVVQQVVVNPEYWRFPDEEYVTLFGHTAKQLRAMLDTDSVRDAFTDTQLAALQFLEKALRDKLKGMTGITTAQALQELRNMAGKLRLILEEINPKYATVKALPAGKGSK